MRMAVRAIGKQQLLHARSSAAIINKEDFVLHSSCCRPGLQLRHSCATAKHTCASAVQAHTGSPVLFPPTFQGASTLVHWRYSSRRARNHLSCVTIAAFASVEPFCIDRKTKCPKRLASNSCETVDQTTPQCKHYVGTLLVLQNNCPLEALHIHRQRLPESMLREDPLVPASIRRGQNHSLFLEDMLVRYVLKHSRMSPIAAIICNNLCFRCSGYAWP